MPKFFISAGEASGDYHGAALARALKLAIPDAEIVGVGGPRMQAAGVRVVQDIAELNMMGLGVVLHLRRLLGIMRKVERSIVDLQPDAAVFIDFPDFNLRVAKRVHTAGVRTVYFIPPKLWAWRSWRANKLKKAIDQLLVIFPFEVDFYAKRGMRAEFVGNPLIDDCTAASRPNPVGAPIVGLVPGSRRQEIATLLPRMLDAVRELKRTHPNAIFRLPAAPSVTEAQLAPAREAGIEILRKPLPEVLSTCDYAWVASGTAALEAALVETPMVVVYIVPPITYAVAKRLVKLSHFSLPNILAGRGVVPELLQDDVNGARLAAEARLVLDDAAHRAKVHAELQQVKALLGLPGAPARAAQAILRELGLQSA